MLILRFWNLNNLISFIWWQYLQSHQSWYSLNNQWCLCSQQKCWLFLVGLLMMINDQFLLGNVKKVNFFLLRALTNLTQPPSLIKNFYFWETIWATLKQFQYYFWNLPLQSECHTKCGQSQNESSLVNQNWWRLVTRLPPHEFMTWNMVDTQNR